MATDNSTMSEPVTELQDPSQKEECPPSIPEHLMYKNRLQEYTQRSSIQLPVYHTFNGGSPHAPRFRSTVLVDGTEYVSPNTFSNRKAAEQDVARVAMDGIFQKTKDDIVPFIREDTIFCKSILNEYAVKMNLERPTYKTEESKELLPVFVSEVTFNGVKFNGETSKNKKEAEQTAARAALLSILDSGSRTAVSEIVKSKSKLFAALSKIKDTGSIQSGTMPTAVSIINDLEVSLNKRKEIETTGETATADNLIAGACGTSLAGSANAQVACLPFHEFKKPKAESSYEVIAPAIVPPIAPPIIFVPPVLGETVESLPCSTSGKKRNRKNKKKAKVGVQGNPQLPISVAPLSQVPPHPVAPLSQVPPHPVAPLSQVPPHPVAPLIQVPPHPVAPLIQVPPHPVAPLSQVPPHPVAQ